MSVRALRQSASLIVVSNLAKRLNKFDYNVLLLKRNKKMRVAPGFSTYPGGKYEASIDESTSWLPLFLDNRQLDVVNERPDRIKGCFEGIINDRTLGNLMRPAADESTTKQQAAELKLPLEVSYRLCAIREAFEETGLLLARKKVSIPPDYFHKSQQLANYHSKDQQVLHKWRKRLHENPNEFLNLFRELDLVPDIMGLHEWANWVTPIIEKVRFNTFMFTCFLPDQPADALLDINQDEMESYEFGTPEQVLEAYKSQQVRFIPPQLYEFTRMSKFTDFQKLSQYSRHRQTYGLQHWIPKFTSDGVIGLLPGDYFYERLDEHNGKTAQDLANDYESDPRRLELRLNRILKTSADAGFKNLKIICNIDFDARSKFFYTNLSGNDNNETNLPC